MRLARREIRGELQHLKSASARYRADIAALKRKTGDLEKQVAHMKKWKARASVPIEKEETRGQARFSASGLRNLRKRLGLSAQDFGSLIEVSGQSVYKWEAEKANPRPRQVVLIAGLRGLGKREAAARLAELASAQK